MTTARHRKHRTDAAMAAWRAERPGPGGGFVPVGWYGRRNPRSRGWWIILPPDPAAESAELLRQLSAPVDNDRGVPLIRGELGCIDSGFSIITCAAPE